MKKKQIIILVVLIILILGGIIGWAVVQKAGLPSGGEITPGEGVEESFSLTATVLSVDTENNFLIVKPAEEEKEIKVVLSDTTKLVKVELPFTPESPPEGATFTPTQTEIELSEFKVGDNVFIKTTENITGKTEFNSVSFIHILP